MGIAVGVGATVGVAVGVGTAVAVGVGVDAVGVFCGIAAVGVGEGDGVVAAPHPDRLAANAAASAVESLNDRLRTKATTANIVSGKRPHRPPVTVLFSDSDLSRHRSSKHQEASGSDEPPQPITKVSRTLYPLTAVSVKR